MTGVRLTAAVLLLGTSVVRASEPESPAPAPAPEPTPCAHAPGNTVVCPLPTFDRLVDKCSTYRRDRDLCRVDLGAAEERITGLTKDRDRCTTDLERLKSLVGKGTPAGEPVRPVAQPIAPVVGFLSGITGTALILAPFLFPQSPDGVKAGLSLVGLGAVGLGFGLSVPINGGE